MTHTNKAPRLASIELMRIIAMLAVIVIHAGLFMHNPLFNDQPIVGYLANQLSRFAVPFFFIVTGFLIQPKLHQHPLATLINYVRPLLTIWLVWSVITLLIPSNFRLLASVGYIAERTEYWQFLWQTPLNSFLEGGLVHLWFLPALIIAVTLIACLEKLNALKALLPLALILYLYGVLAGCYAILTELPSPFLTRNGPFLSLLMVTIGYFIRQYQYNLKLSLILVLFSIGLLGHLSEDYWLSLHDVTFNTHDFLFFTPLWATAIFFLCLRFPTVGDTPLVHALSKHILGVYVAHLSIMIVFYNLVGLYQISGYTKDVIIFFGTLISTLLFVKIIEKTPFNKLLMR
ncbi:acyltransferase [Psychromonas sp. Urea-02u-13]|uniref:acyltransferase n=1 Tax=Psychromonas sp. Urea-02u-13 TaxID=2058326 RepID=UPI000C321387|nr:acyltransferase family protein [Psychromonas sp. Urea-02u-13]PKG40997.1 fucose 4-O-acetylase [Psychromonas sp. Urea-02u-13]